MTAKKKSQWIERRSELTGKSFGSYWRIDCVILGVRHQLQVYATKFELIDGQLLIYDAEDKPYRAFAPGQWTHIAAISCFDGTEMFEDRDLEEITKPPSEGK